MSFEIPPSTVAEQDQRVASMSEILKIAGGIHLENIEACGQTAAMIGLASELFGRLDADPALVVDLLTVAIDKLAKAAV